MELSTFASIFSGGGGADVGAIQAGLKPVFGIEYNAKIAEYYEKNIGVHCTVAKVQDVNPTDYEPVDWLHASPVCKNFSNAKTDGEETDEDVATAKATASFIKVLQPKIFSLENVYAYRNSQSFEIILAELKRLGYRWQFEHVNAANMGVPQTRMRLILIAARKDLPRFAWPTETHHDGPEYSDIWGNVVKPWIGWYSAIEDLIPSLPESKFAEWQLKRLGSNFDKQNGNFLLEGSGARDGKEPNIRGANSPNWTIRASARSDTARAFLISDQHSHEGQFVTTRNDIEPSFTIDTRPANKIKAFVLDGQPAFNGEGLTCRQGEEPFFTLSASMDKRPSRAWLSQGRVVQMTPRALARFQSFPDWYKLPDKNSLACEIIGNAVACLMFQRFIESYQKQLLERAA